MSSLDLRVLIIDDDQIDRKQLIRAMDKSGLSYRADESVNIPDGLQKLSLEGEDVYDCLFLDYMIPGADGLEGLVEIHQKYPYLPIIVMTGQGDELVAAQSLKYGASDYVPKLVLSLNSVRRIIENALERGNFKRRMNQQRIELEDFARILAHDLKAPSRQVEGFVSFIQRDLEDGKHDKISEYLNYVHQATHKMTALVSVKKSSGSYSSKQTMID